MWHSFFATVVEMLPELASRLYNHAYSTYSASSVVSLERVCVRVSVFVQVCIVFSTVQGVLGLCVPIVFFFAPVTVLHVIQECWRRVRKEANSLGISFLFSACMIAGVLRAHGLEDIWKPRLLYRF
eukprot:RCo013433